MHDQQKKFLIPANLDQYILMSRGYNYCQARSDCRNPFTNFSKAVYITLVMRLYGSICKIVFNYEARYLTTVYVKFQCQESHY